MNDFLFVCQENRLRSPTCEHVARSLGYSADSAGTADTAVRPLTVAAIERADKIICMETFHARCVKALAPACSIEIWAIADVYDYCQPELVKLVNDHFVTRRHLGVI